MTLLEEMAGPFDPKSIFHEFTEEELKRKKCEGCQYLSFREHLQKYRCINKRADVSPEDTACSSFASQAELDAEREEYDKRVEAAKAIFWNIYSEKEPVKLPLVQEYGGILPVCPVCGEVPYSTEQCYFCGQRFIQDDEIIAYSTPKTEKGTCLSCGAEVEITISSFNGHRRYRCENCGCSMIE